MSYSVTSDLELHEIFRGRQDNYYDKYIEFKPKWSVIKKKRCVVSKDAKFIKLEKYNEAEYGYANFRIVSNINSIQHLLIQYEWCRDRIYIVDAYPKIINDEYPFDCMKNNMLPIDKYGSYYLYFESTDDFEIEYDICKLTDCIHNNNYKFMINICHVNSTYVNDNKEGCKIMLSFNHPTKRIIIKSSCKLEDIKLIHNGKYCTDNFTEISENCYQRIFDHTINFSSIDSTILFVKSESHGLIEILAESTNILCYNYGRAGILFNN